MRPRRLLILFLVLIGVLIAFYYQRESKVQVETIPFSSKLIGKALPYDVVLPPRYGLITSRHTRYPVMYLLHGWDGHYDSWLKRTALVDYASEHQIIIITPEGNNSWYIDSATTPIDKYETYILEELIPDVDSRFRTVANRSSRAIAGLSMGGYGALKFGLKHPEVFCFVASFSGALDAASRTDDASIMKAFGELNSTERKSNDVFRLAEEFPNDKISQLPYFYLDCGRDDPWFSHNQRFAEILLRRKIPVEFRQLPGSHVWPYWDKQVRDVLRIASETMTVPN